MVDVSVGGLFFINTLIALPIAIINKFISSEIVNIVQLPEKSIKKGLIFGKRIKTKKITDIQIGEKLQIISGRKKINLINYPSEENKSAYIHIAGHLASKTTTSPKTLLKKIENDTGYYDYIQKHGKLTRPLRIILIYLIPFFLNITYTVFALKPVHFTLEMVAVIILTILLVIIVVCIINKKRALKAFVLVFFVFAETSMMPSSLIATFDFMSLLTALLFTIFTALGIYRYFKISRVINHFYIN